MPTYKTAECNRCGKSTQVDTRKYNLYLKRGYNFYCEDCKSIRTQIEHTCAHCGKVFTRIKSAKKSKSGLYFCSQSCAASYNNSAYRTGENNPNWLGGSYKGSSYGNIAFRSYAHKCAMCGLEEDCCLQVHHIDENRENSSLDNLIILCANCHSRVHRGGYKITQDILNNRELVE